MISNMPSCPHDSRPTFRPTRMRVEGSLGRVTCLRVFILRLRKDVPWVVGMAELEDWRCVLLYPLPSPISRVTSRLASSIRVDWRTRGEERNGGKSVGGQSIIEEDLKDVGSTEILSTVSVLKCFIYCLYCVYFTINISD